MRSQFEPTLEAAIDLIQKGILSRRGLNYKEDVSLGAQAAIKLKVLELLIEGKKKEEIKNFVEIFFLMLNEEVFSAFLPVGTEVEIWRRAPYTDKDHYDAVLAGKIWDGLLNLPLGRDELIEFALPPSQSHLSQIAMIYSMIKIGLIPEGPTGQFFSLHISGGLPISLGSKKATVSIANYLELVKAILYTSDNRLDYFSRTWIPLAFKSGSGNVSEVGGEKPSFRIYQEDEEMIRLEYRSGDVSPENSKYSEAISFIQLSHSLMMLALIAAADSQKIENKFMQGLLEIFDQFISDIDKWREGIPEQLKQLFTDDLSRGTKKELSGIINFRTENSIRIGELNKVVVALKDKISEAFVNVGETANQPADVGIVEGLSIVKRLKKALPEGYDLSKELTQTGRFNYLQSIRSSKYHNFNEAIFRTRLPESPDGGGNILDNFWVLMLILPCWNRNLLTLCRRLWLLLFTARFFLSLGTGPSEFYGIDGSGSVPVSIDLATFQGFTFQIIKIEPIKDLNKILA